MNNIISGIAENALRCLYTRGHPSPLDATQCVGKHTIWRLYAERRTPTLHTHYINCYGNIKDEQYLELAFDVNTVPPADYNHDYEEVWHEQSGTISSAIRDFVDGKSSQKGYYYDH